MHRRQYYDAPVDVAGGGCCGLIVLFTGLGFIILYWKQMLLVGFAAAAVYGLFVWARNSWRAAEARRRCPVCQHWSGSVIMTDFTNTAGMCPPHAARWRRIVGLEGDVLHGD